MKKILFEYGVESEFIERKKINDEYISASKLRDGIETDFESIKKYLSQDVYEYLKERCLH